MCYYMATTSINFSHDMCFYHSDRGKRSGGFASSESKPKKNFLLIDWAIVFNGEWVLVTLARKY